MKLAAKMRENSKEISKRIVEKQIKEKKLDYSPNRVQKSISDSVSNLNYLASSIELKRSSVFNNYILWLGEILVKYDVSIKELIDHLVYIKDEIYKLDEPSEEKIATDYVDHAIHILKNTNFEKETDEDNDKSWNKYIDALIEGNKEKAEGIVKAEYEKDHNIRRIYEDIFVRVMHKTGKMWQDGKISVAKEHYITAITQNIITTFYDKIIKTKKNGMSVIVSCIGDELHELGIRMISDIFEIEGFDTYYLGSNIPSSEILKEVQINEPNVVALSVTMPFYLSDASNLITSIKNLNPDIYIAVGGRAFDMNEGMWQEVGADLYLKNGFEAPKIIKEILEKKYE